LFRKGERALLAEATGNRVIEEASTANDALGAVETHEPDLLLHDSALSGSGFELVKAVQRVQPHTRVLLMLASAGYQPAEVPDGVGVAACVSKESTSEKLVPAIRKMAPMQTSSLLDLANIHEAANRPFGGTSKKALTPREQQVLDQLMRGATSREIAETLGLSLKTIDAHKFNLMRKLDVHSRGDLIKLAIRQQISSYRNESVAR